MKIYCVEEHDLWDYSMLLKGFKNWCAAQEYRDELRATHKGDLSKEAWLEGTDCTDWCEDWSEEEYYRWVKQSTEEAEWRFSIKEVTVI